MAKPSAGFHTPRSSTLRSSSASSPAARSSVGSSSSSSSAVKLPVSAFVPRDLASKAVVKCLDYDDDFNLSYAASTLPPDAMPEEDEHAPLLDLPDPEVSASASAITVISAASDDVSADSCVSEVAAPADSTADSSEAPLQEQINLVLSELHGASGLSPRSKRLLAALAEAATAELNPTATTRRLRRSAFWRKVRVAVLAVTVATVVAVDVGLAAYLYARRMNDQYHVLPPT